MELVIASRIAEGVDGDGVAFKWQLLDGFLSPWKCRCHRGSASVWSKGAASRPRAKGLGANSFCVDQRDAQT